MANTSCGPSTRYSSRTGRAYLGHRPDRIDAGRAGYRSVHAFPGRFRLSPRRRLTLFTGTFHRRSAASSIGYIQVCIHVRNFGYPRTGRIFYRSSLCQQVLDPACIHDRLVHRAPLLPVAIAPHCGIQLQLKQPFFARRASRTPPSSSSISQQRSMAPTFFGIATRFGNSVIVLAFVVLSLGHYGGSVLPAIDN